jgi:hypothetical protein
MPIPFNEGALVVTSISTPNPVLKALAECSLQNRSRFIIIGDRKSPSTFELPGSEFYGIPEQRALPFSYAKLCPEHSYTRKNIGYLLAIAGGAKFIVETDDDNYPREAFWQPRDVSVTGSGIAGEGWVNAYHYFSDAFIYPRGYPIDLARSEKQPSERRALSSPSYCPIQQGLADENPDVDAIYRMLYPLPFNFRQDEPLILSNRQWCPFNSQNTTTFPEIYPLLYLPAFCSFRMTDIWRSFVTQRILWTLNASVSFHSATVYQDRNSHNLLRDFADEISGYLNNEQIARKLDALQLSAGVASIEENMKSCYRALIDMKLIAPDEITLLNGWFQDLRQISSGVLG